jgi:hypothetical protein
MIQHRFSKLQLDISSFKKLDISSFYCEVEAGNNDIGTNKIVLIVTVLCMMSKNI